uniref:LuxR C-terminal-related transcriptional regulator n=1 Tax=Roseivirga sp. TaxID=1964215 RepID=UPI00404714DE
MKIIQLIYEEKATGKIADQLSMSTHTVERYRANVLLKREFKSSSDLVKRVIQNEIVK